MDDIKEVPLEDYNQGNRHYKIYLTIDTQLNKQIPTVKWFYMSTHDSKEQ